MNGVSGQSIGYAEDARSGLAIPQPRVRFHGPRATGVGHLVYRCHTCGELIVKPWEVFFVAATPGAEWASSIAPATSRLDMTTHHDWHMAATQDGS